MTDQHNDQVANFDLSQNPEAVRAYLAHLETMRQIEAARSARLFEYLDRITEHSKPIPIDDETRKKNLRDHIAVAAMEGLLMNGNGPNSPWVDHLPSLAKWSYDVSEAMMAERATR